MSLGLKGAFCPTILPLFHGSRELALLAVLMMVSHRVEGHKGCACRTSGGNPIAGNQAECLLVMKGGFLVVPRKGTPGHLQTFSTGSIRALH